METDQTDGKMRLVIDIDGSNELTYRSWRQFTLAINFAFNGINNISTLCMDEVREYCYDRRT